MNQAPGERDRGARRRIFRPSRQEAADGRLSLKLSGISKRYPGVHALDAWISNAVAGEVHAVLGENGSGKSTLLGIASGAVTPDGGVIEIMGKPLTTADPLLARQPWPCDRLSGRLRWCAS